MLSRVPAWAFAAVLLLAAAAAVWRHPAPAAVSSIAPASAVQNSEAAFYQSQFISQSLTDFNHAAAITELANGDRLAVWFSGSREGADDVVIAQARWDKKVLQWQPSQPLLTRDALIAEQQLFTGKLGNPVIATAPDGKVWLFVVAATYFGWGSSTVNVLTSSDNGHNWSRFKRLQLTPFFNLSTLVRSAPVFYQDGTIGLPIYRESVGKFPQWLHLDADGNVIDQQRANKGRGSLQPAVVAFGNELTMLMRTADAKKRRVLTTHSDDAGMHWHHARTTEIPNPNSGLSAVVYSDNDMLVALNDVEKGRHQLSLYRVDKAAKQWRKLATIEKTELASGELRAPFAEAKVAMANALQANQSDNPTLDSGAYIAALEKDNERVCGESKGCEFYYDYPYLYRDSHDQFHLVYSWNKSFIKHVIFNRAWVEQAK